MYFHQYLLFHQYHISSQLSPPDAVGRPLEVVVPPGLHEGQVERLGRGLDVVGGEGGCGSEDGDDAGVHEVAQLLAGLEAVVLRVPGHRHVSNV